MISLWFPYGFSMVFLWFSLVFPWFSYGKFQSNSIKPPFSYAFPMVFPWFSYNMALWPTKRDVEPRPVALQHPAEATSPCVGGGGGRIRVQLVDLGARGSGRAVLFLGEGDGDGS